MHILAEGWKSTEGRKSAEGRKNSEGRKDSEDRKSSEGLKDWLVPGILPHNLPGSQALYCPWYMEYMDPAANNGLVRRERLPRSRWHPGAGVCQIAHKKRLEFGKRLYIANRLAQGTFAASCSILAVL